jgi:zinc protease
MTYKMLTVIILVCFNLILPAFGLQSEEILSSITSFRLENGLQVILAEDYSIPVVSVVVAYKVGSINDIEGKTGLAYLVGIQMFQGSRNIRKLQHINYINRIGGKLHAQTGVDKTMFGQTVSSNHLATVLWMEADRMISLNITAENVDQAKIAIIEEIINQKYADPYLENAIQFDGLLFGHHSYSHSLHGKEADIREISVDDVKEFYSTYYKPNNAVLCITGNIDNQKTMRLVKRYFQTIPPGKKVPSAQVNISQETEGISIAIKNSLASTPGFFLGYRISPPGNPDYYSLVIIDYILLKGKSSRLRKRLMRRERLATQIQGGIDIREDRAVFKLFVITTNQYTKEMSQKTIFSEINRLRSTPISDEELERAKNMFKRDYFQRFSTSMDKAIFLAEAFLSGINLMELPNEFNKYLSVSAAGIIGVMNRYFRQSSIMLNIDIK